MFVLFVFACIIISPLALIILIIAGAGMGADKSGKTGSGHLSSTGAYGSYDDYDARSRGFYDDSEAGSRNSGGYNSMDNYYERLDSDPSSVDPEVLAEEDPEMFEEFYGDL